MESVSAQDDLLKLMIEHELNYLASLKNGEESCAMDNANMLTIATAQQLYSLIKKALINELSETMVNELANQITEEYVEANMKSADFIHDINLQRSSLLQLLFFSNANRKLLQESFSKINCCLDKFCYYALKRFSTLKKQKMEETKLLIEQSHKDKLTILGQMSSSFVHEFRNPLTAVIGFVKLLKTDHPNLKYIDIIDHELDQLKFRITQFLHTSKNEGAQEQRKEILAIQPLIEEIIKFLYPSIVDIDVNVLTDYRADTSTIANKNEIKQVLLNILMNSIDAINKKEKPREITITTYTEADYTIIDISNNGPEIPSETREIIFEPFYTTKELGTGIGLFVCKKIIEKHKGFISCLSNECVTTFRISLPLSLINEQF